MTATAQTAPVARRRETARLSTLWYVRYALTGVAFGAAWLSEHGASLGMHALRGGLVLAAALAIVLWRWWQWMGADAVRRWAALAATDAVVLLAAYGLAPVLAHPHGRPDVAVAVAGGLAVAILSPLVHHLVGGPRGYRAPQGRR